MRNRESVGIDIEEIRRFRSLSRNKRFLARVYSSEELAYCRSKKNCAQHLAVRFAAKEAIWKAISDVLRSRSITLSHRDISVRNDRFGKPRASLPSRLKSIESRLSVSLSHSREYAAAVAMLAR